MGWHVDEEVNRDKTDEADGMNLDVETADSAQVTRHCIIVPMS